VRGADGVRSAGGRVRRRRRLRRGGGSGGGGGFAGGGDGNSEFSVQTELDLGQPFAEEPNFEVALGPVTVTASASRGGGTNAQIPITFLLTNSGQANLRGVAITIRFRVVEGTDPEDVPVPDPGEPALELAPETTKGTCATDGATSSAATIDCTLGRLTSGAWR
jgi:hypothetical protein